MAVAIQVFPHLQVRLATTGRPIGFGGRWGRQARLIVGSNTGPLHLAAAVGTPCVGLYGPWPADKHGPYGPQHIGLQELIFEGPTRARRTASRKYMEAIRVEHVCAACDEILARDNRQVA